MLLLKNVLIISPGSKHNNKKRDVLIHKGEIQKIRAKINQPKARVIQIPGSVLSPGWLDVGTQICDPGFEHREDIQSVSAAAAAGGFTGLAVFPNTSPVIQSKSEVLYLKNNTKNNLVDFFPIGAISKNCAGEDITEMYDMQHTGAVAYSDGAKPVQSNGLLMRALQYVKGFDGLIMNHPQDKSIAAKGQLHEGKISTSLGMSGIPALAEELMVQRDINLAEYTDSRIHLGNISSAGSVDQIKKAKAKGLKVTASVAVMNLTNTDEDVAGFDSNFKVLPPLRENSDRQALIKGLKSGVIDFISSNHTPLEGEQKELEFPHAGFGAIGLQTAFALLMTNLSKQLSLEQMVSYLAVKPREVLGLDGGLVTEGVSANLTLFHPTKKWKFEERDILSKSKNSPYLDQTFTGKVLGIFNNEKHRFFND